ncbi:hypothetical protein TWF696_005296 [Orbilia brochopaga]|uniref:Zn(2)-C6 fungal-type domain-containing protein n=1 Tax=Orbilia brochopaga TaxID=3140254 RepID=A0AAV9V6X9_9PEZI
MAGRGPPTGPPTPDIVARASTPGSTSSKVAIPRLKRDPELATFGPQQGSEKSRVSHACEPCRQRKTKCDGGRPCRHCFEFRINCFYGDGKREKAKNEARYLQERVETYEKTLENIYANDKLDTEVRTAIVNALKDSANWQERLEGSVKAVDEKTQEKTAPEGSRVFMRLDKLSDDFGATASTYRYFLGVSPCLPWAVDANLDNIPTSGTERAPATSSKSSKGKGSKSGKGKEPARQDEDNERKRAFDARYLPDEFTYNLEDLTPMTDLPSLEQCTELPNRRVVDAFVEGYFNTVHLAYPILYKPQFIKEYRAYMERNIKPQPLRTWLATINIVMAIGSLFTQLTDETKTKWSTGYDAHIFWVKAQVLYYNGGALTNNTNQRHVQALGVLGIYYLATKQINRCWEVVGLAIRGGYSLGLHLSSEPTQLNRIEQEIRHRKWYALMSLERICGLLTGRPVYMDENKYCIPFLSGVNEDKLEKLLERRRKAKKAKKGTEPPPAVEVDLDALVKREEELQNTDPRNGFFLQGSKLYSVSLDILANVYTPGASKLTWRQAEDLIAFAGLKLERWRIGGGDALFPTPTTPDPDIPTRRKKNLLYLDYLNTVILLNWPLLCRVKATEADQSKASNKTASIACLNAALDTLRLLPDDTIQPIEFWNAFPWWIILYYIVASGLVIVTEIALGGEHMPEQKDDLYNNSEKALLWLDYLGQTDLAAKRSRKVLADLLAAASRHIDRHYVAPPAESEGPIAVMTRINLYQHPHELEHLRQQQELQRQQELQQQQQQQQQQLQRQRELQRQHIEQQQQGLLQQQLQQQQRQQESERQHAQQQRLQQRVQQREQQEQQQQPQQHQDNDAPDPMQEVQHEVEVPRPQFQNTQYAPPIAQHPMQGYTFPSNPTVTTAPLSDLSQQHQTLLGAQGINVLAPPGYENMSIVDSYAYQPIADGPASAADQGSIDHPMQLASNDPHWSWQGYPPQVPPQVQVQIPLQPMQQIQQIHQMQPIQQIPSPHHGSEHHTPVHEYAPAPDFGAQFSLGQMQQLQQMQQIQQIHSPHHSEQHTPIHEYPSSEFHSQAHLYQPVPGFPPGYHPPIYDDQAEGGYHHSPVEQEYAHGTPSPGHLHPHDAQYHHRGRGQ